jgi:hypothetical protein
MEIPKPTSLARSHVIIAVTPDISLMVALKLPWAEFARIESASSRDDLPTPLAPIRTVRGRNSRSTWARRRNPLTVRLRKRWVEFSTAPSSLIGASKGNASSRALVLVPGRAAQLCPGLYRILPILFLERLHLCAVQRGMHSRWVPRIHFVQTFRDRIDELPFQELRDRFSVQITPRNSKATGCCFRLEEKIIGYRDGGLHDQSITRASDSGNEALKKLALLVVLRSLILGVPLHS